jgi:hypothetical protein
LFHGHIPGRIYRLIFGLFPGLIPRCIPRLIPRLIPGLMPAFILGLVLQGCPIQGTPPTESSTSSQTAAVTTELIAGNQFELFLRGKKICFSPVERRQIASNLLEYAGLLRRSIPPITEEDKAAMVKMLAGSSRQTDTPLDESDLYVRFAGLNQLDLFRKTLQEISDAATPDEEIFHWAFLCKWLNSATTTGSLKKLQDSGVLVLDRMAAHPALRLSTVGSAIQLFHMRVFDLILLPHLAERASKIAPQPDTH